MASLKSGSVSDSASGGFSYAQAAKGRSPSVPATKMPSSAASGTATPSSSTAISDLTPGSSWADDAESSAADGVLPKKPAESRAPESPALSKSVAPTEAVTPAFTSSDSTSPDTAMSSSTPNNNNDDTASSHNTSSEATWDSKSSSSDPPPKTGDMKEEKATSEEASTGEAKEAKEVTPPKPALQEAKAPAVNIWLQRAEAMKAKGASQPLSPSASSSTTTIRGEAEKGRADPKKKRNSMAVTTHDFEQLSGAAKDSRKIESIPRARDDVRTSHPRRESRPDETVPNAPRRMPPVKAREHSSSESAPPPVKSEGAWPKPMDALQEERKKLQEKDDKAEKERAAAANAGKAHGKTEWKVMPYTPTAVFETNISGRGGSRMGRGAARGAAAGASGRGAFQGATSAGDGTKPAARASSLPNGETEPTEQSTAAKADREAMPPPPAKAIRAASDGHELDSQSTDLTPKANSQTKDEASTSPSSGKGPESGPAETNSRQPAPRRNKSPRKSDFTSRRTGGAEEVSGRTHFNAAETEGPDGVAFSKEQESSTARSGFSDRQQSLDTTRDVPPFRENTGKRGRRGGSRATANGHFASPHQYNNMNGFQDYQTGQYGAPSQAPFHSPRGGHFPQQGRNGYRNNGIRSQSIPMDAYGRPQYPGGYPMMQQMQPFMPDYYGNFSGAPFQYPPSEKDLVMAAVTQQLEYYFSIDNMVKDIFLRKHMDSQGYIFLRVIAEFNRLKQLTTDYDLLKSVCLQSTIIEIRVGDDGKDRLRRVDDWERWILPMADRDPSAQTDGPASVRRPSAASQMRFEQPPFYPRSPASAGLQGTFGKADRSFHMMNGGPPPFYPSGVEPGYGDFAGHEETRGRQAKPVQHQESSISPLANGFTMPSDDGNSEPDTFPSSQIDGLTVVVRKHDIAHQRVPFHNANSRTFSNGSIDSRSIMEEVSKASAQETKVQVNGETTTNGESSHNPSATPSPNADAQSPDGSALTLFWVKDKEAPVDIGSLPADTTHELYSVLRMKAIDQRQAAATGTCPYDLDVLYQFWSHFLIRNFNSQMYSEFRQLASSDTTQRHNDTGISNLIKYYSESLSSQIPIRDNVAKDYVELVKSESSNADRPAFKQLRAAWRNGALNLKNRKKLGDLLDSSIKSELDA